MIDNFSLGLTHGLLMLAAFLLMRRPDLDHEAGPSDAAPPTDTPPPEKRQRWGRPRA